MAKPNSNEQYNNQFAQELVEIKLKMELIFDAINALDGSIRGTFDLLTDQGLLPENAAGVVAYDKTMAQLRKLGLPSVRPTGKPQMACPNCKTMLRIAGNAGDRCEWCGYEF